MSNDGFLEDVANRKARGRGARGKERPFPTQATINHERKKREIKQPRTRRRRRGFVTERSNFPFPFQPTDEHSE